MSIPVATVIGAEMVEDPICESIKTLRDSYMEFCDDEDEFNANILPIEKDPHPYANGSIKTKPILKKYANALLEKINLDIRMKSAVTPTQDNPDYYASISEKKIAKQQEMCDQLQRQVEQLTEVVLHCKIETDYLYRLIRVHNYV